MFYVKDVIFKYQDLKITIWSSYIWFLKISCFESYLLENVDKKEFFLKKINLYWTGHLYEYFTGFYSK